MLNLKSDKTIGGLTLLAIAAGFAWAGKDLAIGRAVRMGPGWAPMALALLLAGLGAVLLARGLFDRAQPTAHPPWPRRAAIPVLGSMLLFGLTIESLGLLLASGLSMFLAASGAADVKWREAFIVSTAMAIGVSLLFGTGLGLSVKILP